MLIADPGRRAVPGRLLSFPVPLEPATALTLPPWPSFSPTVSLTSSKLNVAESREKAEGYVSSFVQQTGWQPTKVGLFAGALRYTQYDDPTRDLLVSVAARTGKPTDISRDHEFTDWNAINRFAEAVLSDVSVTA